MNKEEFINSKMKLSKEDIIYNYYETEEKLIEKLGIERELYELKERCKKQKEVVGKAIETLEKGITFCENDSQGTYDICNIAINREKKVLNILKEVSK